MPVVLTALAFADLVRIRDYIGQNNSITASQVAVQLVAACDRPEHLSERGRPGLLPGTHELVALWPYIIVYRIDQEEVQILRIWHGAQNR